MAATFSYAQAAKGVAPAQPSNVTTEPTLASKPEQNDENTAQEAENTVTSKAEESQETEKAPVNSEKESESAAVENPKADVSGTSSPSVGNSTSTLPKDDEGSNTPNGTSESTWDKQSQASGTDKQSNGVENAKEKSAGKEKSVPPKELKAAPLPAVNIWQQRKEAQEAKVKATTTVKPTGSAAKTGTSKATSTASSISGENQQDQPKAGSKKKGADIDGAKDRRAKGRDDTLPPVGDSALWPTPQGAQGEEKKKSDRSPVIRPSGKEKWTPVPYVPTAVFTTPLPSAGRRGGRAPRAGRDGARNGTHASAAAADKATSGQVTQGSANKQAAPAERGRNEPSSARANSLPAPSRRSNSADAGLTDSRKNQAADRSRGPKGADNANVPPAGKHVNDNFRHAKGFSRNHDATHKGGDHTRNANVPVDAQAGPRSGSSHERRFENGPKSADFGGFHDRKDKEFSRESRAERGRGSHRGRGGFGGSQNSHYPNNHMSHNNFMHPKSFGFGERRSQQHSSGGHRMSLRSPSLPNSASMYGVYPFPTDINTMYGYQPMHPGPMTALPYQQYMEPFSLMSMISMQLEYYFSVDNLCKDLFLRRHMDSQGFVPLAFIAGFKRIKTLTEDFELLRHVSRQLRNVDYLQSEDGVDRLRPKESWGQWVLPVDQRETAAQHDSPSPANPNKQDETAAAKHADGAVNGSAPLVNGIGEAPASKTLSSDAPVFSPSQAVDSQNEASTPAN
ncbi:hypothetical protein BDV29DRAFT_121393 [Aspergillus leporis]|uniref:HTH La-type RNA-binding domain-containing protein n=1 Tax=Aspergillus leporis TaxID=41062 RepID=A0A5N5XDX6_9EURO|nr:hypothetical protein BDV29DRAFT_121393 [Aspergillus leporis]